MLLAVEERLFKATFKSHRAINTLEELYKQYFFEYFESLFHYAFTIVKNDAEAKDIVQTVFIKLWQKRNDIDFTTSARPYLYTSVYNQSLNTIRNRKIRNSHHDSLAVAEAGNSQDPAEERETRIRIQRAIDSLPPKCKEVFVKSRFEGKKYIEIAADMNISIKTVEVQMSKALKYLREQLSDLALIFLIYLSF